jgi:transposase
MATLLLTRWRKFSYNAPATIMRCTVATIQFHQHQIQSLDLELQELMKPLNIKLESMTGISHVAAAYLIAEIGNVHRFTSADKLSSSGDNHRHRKSKQGDRDLHELIEQLAVRQIAVTRTNKEPHNTTSMTITCNGWRQGRQRSKRLSAL